MDELLQRFEFEHLRWRDIRQVRVPTVELSLRADKESDTLTDSVSHKVNPIQTHTTHWRHPRIVHPETTVQRTGREQEQLLRTRLVTKNAYKALSTSGVEIHSLVVKKNGP